MNSQLADGLIAATARETSSMLATGNIRHLRVIPAVQLKAFKPGSSYRSIPQKHPAAATRLSARVINFHRLS